MIRSFGRPHCLHIEVTELCEVDAEFIQITVFELALLGKLQLRQAGTEGEIVLS
jgi:hypothetical protein